jgi:hypothetical protein
MKRLILSFLLMSSAMAMTIDSDMVFSQRTLDDILKRYSVGYFIDFNGPKLNKVSSNETFDRFRTGKDGANEDMDGTNNLYYFSTISLNYKLSRRMTIGYSSSLHHHVTSGAPFDENTWECPKDGRSRCDYVKRQNNRNSEHVNYNHRLTSFINIYSNSTFGLSTGINYEFPTSVGAQLTNTSFALNLTPSIIFWGRNGISYGMQTDFTRFYYDVDETYSQVFTATLFPYIDQVLSDKSRMRYQLIFDWDQTGDESRRGFYDSNMEDGMRIMYGRAINRYVYTNLYVEYSIVKPAIDKSYLGANMSVTF